MSEARDIARESRRVATIAAMLELDESQVRRLVDEGELEAHRIGKRGLRVYLESVAAYQARQARPATRKLEHRARVNAARRAVATSAHRFAMAELEKAGILRR